MSGREAIMDRLDKLIRRLERTLTNAGFSYNSYHIDPGDMQTWIAGEGKLPFLFTVRFPWSSNPREFRFGSIQFMENSYKVIFVDTEMLVDWMAGGTSLSGAVEIFETETSSSPIPIETWIESGGERGSSISVMAISKEDDLASFLQFSHVWVPQQS